MKKILLILILFLCINSAYAACSPERLGLNQNNTYSLDGIDYEVSIKETAGQLNSFDVTINGITYTSVHYESSFKTDAGETAYLGQPYAASSVMYTSIDFCMEKSAETGKETITGNDSNYLYYALAGVIAILLIIIFYLLLRKKK